MTKQSPEAKRRARLRARLNQRINQREGWGERYREGVAAGTERCRRCGTFEDVQVVRFPGDAFLKSSTGHIVLCGECQTFREW